MKLAISQFQPKDGDKEFNLQIMEELVIQAKSSGADVIAFHEMCITAYTFLKDLSREGLVDLGENLGHSHSLERLKAWSTEHDIAILAGLLEYDDEALYNTYVAVDHGRLLSKFRKLHPFISPHLSAGNEYAVFDLRGWRCGILICYDNNVIENVRATTLLGAEIIFAPHVTGCTPSAMPGRGYVSDDLWKNRNSDPEKLRAEFDGPKGRGWIMRWLPARAYDNAVYYAFANPIGYDGEHLKNGNAMVLDPFGEVLCETRSFEAEVAVAEITKEKLLLAGGFRYRNARRPSLYRDILGADHAPVLKPAWMHNSQAEDFNPG